jgi:formylglycine-generating enzyme required for sulfatase activity
VPAAEGSRTGKGGKVWNPAIFLGDCLEILVRGKALVPEDLRTLFKGMVFRAIEQEIAVKDRHALPVSLGYLGDPWIVVDLRAHGNPDEHEGYIEIPEGTYRYGEEREALSIQELFWLTRYPVTNSQFALFIEDDGYRRQELWSREGRSWLTKENIGKPGYWGRPDFCAPNQPMVGASFWEAEAFAAWAGGALPGEQQWEAAARGPEGYEYPWGGKWEDGICNSRESGLRITSAVGIFPRSRSKPFELEDMAGNVWEWCNSKEASDRVVRGGCWYDYARGCRASLRGRSVPQSRINDLGFRVALVPPGEPAGSSKQERTQPGAEAEGAEMRSPPPRAVA